MRYAEYVARMPHEHFTRKVFFAAYDQGKHREQRLTWRKTVDSLCSNLSTKQANNCQRCLQPVTHPLFCHSLPLKSVADSCLGCLLHPQSLLEISWNIAQLLFNISYYFGLSCCQWYPDTINQSPLHSSTYSTAGSQSQYCVVWLTKHDCIISHFCFSVTTTYIQYSQKM